MQIKEYISLKNKKHYRHSLKTFRVLVQSVTKCSNIKECLLIYLKTQHLQASKESEYKVDSVNHACHDIRSFSFTNTL